MILSTVTESPKAPEVSEPLETLGDPLQSDQTPERVTRPRSESLDQILGQPFAVLDEGFVRAVDYMGNDSSIVQAARVSYGKGTKTIHEDRGLIRYLLRHRHTTPLEMCELKLHVKVPMDCWRQWIRHRTANVNEYSTRYSEAHDSMQQTPMTGWRSQSSTNKQGSADQSENLDESLGRTLSERELAFHEEARALYQERLRLGVAKEQARKDLPLSTYTEAYWKIDLHNLLHFLSLRLHPHAQLEIREYANVIGYQIVKRWCPIVWEAFEDYRLNAVSLTVAETTIVAALIREDTHSATAMAIQLGMLNTEGKPIRNRERSELEEKLQILGLTPPWLASSK